MASSTIADGCQIRKLKRTDFYAFLYLLCFAFFFGFLINLQAVGEDDVGVHCPNIQMVNEGAFNSVWNLLQGRQLFFDLIANL